MSQTRADLVRRALKNLGALPQGQTASDEEYDSVDDHVEPMLEWLSGRDIVYVADPDVIDDAYFLPLGHILASVCQAEFGAADDAALIALAQKAELDLKAIGASRPTYAVMKPQYY